MELVITRSEWLRGEGSDDSYMLRAEDNKKCCLGFHSLQCGVLEQKIANMTTPSEVQKMYPQDALWLFGDGELNHGLSQDCLALMKVNDDDSIPDRVRESRIGELFAQNGVNVTFVD